MTFCRWLPAVLVDFGRAVLPVRDVVGPRAVHAVRRAQPHVRDSALRERLHRRRAALLPARRRGLPLVVARTRQHGVDYIVLFCTFPRHTFVLCSVNYTSLIFNIVIILSDSSTGVYILLYALFYYIRRSQVCCHLLICVGKPDSPAVSQSAPIPSLNNILYLLQYFTDERYTANGRIYRLYHSLYEFLFFYYFIAKSFAYKYEYNIFKYFIN